MTPTTSTASESETKARNERQALLDHLEDLANQKVWKIRESVQENPEEKFHQTRDTLFRKVWLLMFGLIGKEDLRTQAEIDQDDREKAAQKGQEGVYDPEAVDSGWENRVVCKEFLVDRILDRFLQESRENGTASKPVLVAAMILLSLRNDSRTPEAICLEQLRQILQHRLDWLFDSRNEVPIPYKPNLVWS